MNLSSTSHTVKPRVTVKDFVQFLINPCEPKQNVTGFPYAGLNSISESINLNLLDVKDNLERITKFKKYYFHKLKLDLDNTLLNQDRFSNESSEEVSGTNLLRKSERISIQLRSAGNEYYKQNNLDKALRCYTLACSYAPKGSSVEALAYSNRSACFFEINNSRLCLQDIERFEVIWSDEDDQKVVEKIARRKSKCLKKLKNDGEIRVNDNVIKAASDYFKLKSPSKTIPNAEQFIGIRCNDERGRHLVNIGNEPIPPGTVVIIEKPYAFVIYETYTFALKNCGVCLRNLNGGGIPCDGCVFVLYCSEECACSIDSQRHKSYECKISPFLYELDMHRQLYLSLSILLNLTPSGFLEHLRSIYGPNRTSTSQIAGFSSSGMYESSSYWTLYNLAYHNENEEEIFIEKYCIDALVVTEILDVGTDYFTSLENKLMPHETFSLKDEFSALLLLHQLNLRVNAHALHKVDKLKSPDGREPETIGGAVFPLQSLINHSCDPTITGIMLHNGTTAIITTQHILPGQELLDNYGTFFADENREGRRLTLQATYNFMCNCSACKDNWPTLEEIPPNSVRICPLCRMKPDGEGFSSNILKILSNRLVCFKCKWKISKDNAWKEYEYYAAKTQNEDVDLTSKPFDTLKDAVQDLKYLDVNYPKPTLALHAVFVKFTRALNCIQTILLE